MLVGLQMDEVFALHGGNDTLHAGRGNDRAHGGPGNDRLFGDTGADVLMGDDGNDMLYGGGGADTLVGGAGRDMLRGGLSADTLVGGSGADIFEFGAREGTDHIQDFADGVDRIRIVDPQVHGFADLAVRQNGSATEVAFHGTLIEIDGLDHHALTAADFILPVPADLIS